MNDFSLVIATVNGSGSQTANGLLARTIFKMGVPVGSKNLFASNISGLPPGVVNVMLGPGGSVGEAIIEHPDISLISFTGSMGHRMYVVRTDHRSADSRRGCGAAYGRLA